MPHARMSEDDLKKIITAIEQTKEKGRGYNMRMLEEAKAALREKKQQRVALERSRN
jgi:hypothetical protein